MGLSTLKISREKYNQLKPFIVDVSISEISGKIITELNKLLDISKNK